MQIKRFNCLDIRYQNTGMVRPHHLLSWIDSVFVLRALSSVLVLLVIAALSSCATLVDSKACLAGDWGALGQQDALDGYSADSRLKLYNSACSSQNIAVDQQLYDTGFARGLSEFCLPDNAHLYGRAELTYQYNCPAETEEAFLTAYASGLSERHEWLRTNETFLQNRLVDAHFRLRFFEQIEQPDPVAASGTRSFIARGHSVSRAIESKIYVSQDRRVHLRNLLKKARQRLTEIQAAK